MEATRILEEFGRGYAERRPIHSLLRDLWYNFRESEMKTLSSDIREQVIALAHNRLSSRQIAAQLQISKSCAADIVLNSIGRKRQSPLRKLEQLGYNDQDIVELYNKYKSCTVIAKQLGISREPIRQALHRLGKLPVFDGRIEQKDGYVFIRSPNHPRAGTWGYVREHILVWEQVHNRFLPQGWVVHHLNGIRGDNRPSNLIGLPNKKHALLLASKAKRIREVEAENALLRRVLETGQMLLGLGEN